MELSDVLKLGTLAMFGASAMFATASFVLMQRTIKDIRESYESLAELWRSFKEVHSSIIQSDFTTYMAQRMWQQEEEIAKLKEEIAERMQETDDAEVELAATKETAVHLERENDQLHSKLSA